MEPAGYAADSPPVYLSLINRLMSSHFWINDKDYIRVPQMAEEIPRYLRQISAIDLCTVLYRIIPLKHCNVSSLHEF